MITKNNLKDVPTHELIKVYKAFMRKKSISVNNYNNKLALLLPRSHPSERFI